MAHFLLFQTLHMPRPPRKLLLEDGSYFHITWKCHNNEFLLADEKIKEKLYSLLLKYKHRFSIKIYGYCFMNNHPHLVGSCQTVENLSRFFQCVNSQLAMFVNRFHGRRGQVIMDRFHSCRIENERYLLTALRYIDRNPVRAGICNHPQNYRWSSFHHYSARKKDPLIDPLPCPLSQQQYLELHELVDDLKKMGPVLNKIYFWGSSQWIEEKRKEFTSKWQKTCARGS